MPTLSDAENALEAAQEAQEKARLASQTATARAADLRAQIKAGGRGAAKITPALIAEADAAAEHAALTYEGASAALPGLVTAVKDARADEACDEVLAELPHLGQDVAAALQTLEAVLPGLVAAAERYDTFVASAVHHLEKVAPDIEPAYTAGTGIDHQRRGGTAASPFVAGAEEPATSAESLTVRPSRFRHGRHSAPTVDGVALTSCRGPGQLATVLLPAMRDLGASDGLLEGLKLLAAGAPLLPSPNPKGTP